METSREAIFDSVRRGFAAAYDSLELDPTKKVRGPNFIPCQLSHHSQVIHEFEDISNDCVNRDKVSILLKKYGPIRFSVVIPCI